MKTVMKEACGLGTTNSIDNPRNREVATAVQLHQTTQMLFAVAHSTPESFARSLRTLQAQIDAYYQMTKTQ